MAHAAYRDVTRTQIWMVDSGVPAGHHDMVQVAVEGSKSSRTGRGLGKFVEQVRTWGQLADQRQRLSSASQQRAGVGSREGDQRVQAAVTAETLHIVASYQTTEAVADDLDPFVTGFCTEFVDGRPQVHRRAANVAGEQPVVETGEVAEPPAAQGPVQHGEDRMVVPDAVNQQDRRRSDLDSFMHDRPLLRIQAGKGWPAAHLWSRLGEDSDWVHDQMCADPGRFNGDAGGNPRYPTGPPRDATNGPVDHAARLLRHYAGPRGRRPARSRGRRFRCRAGAGVDAAADRGGQTWPGWSRSRRQGCGPGTP